MMAQKAGKFIDYLYFAPIDQRIASFIHTTPYFVENQ